MKVVGVCRHGQDFGENGHLQGGRREKRKGGEEGGESKKEEKEYGGRKEERLEGWKEEKKGGRGEEEGKKKERGVRDRRKEAEGGGQSGLMAWYLPRLLTRAHSDPNFSTRFLRFMVAASRMANTLSISHCMHSVFSFSSKTSTPCTKIAQLNSYTESTRKRSVASLTLLTVPLFCVIDFAHR